MQTKYALLADAVLLLHTAVIVFNIGALPVIWLGHWRGWRFIRNPYFRLSHLLLIGFVTAETVLGVICPLTRLEVALRARGGAGPQYPDGFVTHWLHRLIFWDVPTAVFVIVYAAFFGLVLVTFLRIRPNPFSHCRQRSS